MLFRSLERRLLVSASAFSLPARMRGSVGSSPSIASWTSPASRSCRAWVLPRYGMWTMNTPAIDLNSSALRCVAEPLPAEPYVYAEWQQASVGQDYHVEIEKHFYSVPSRLLREEVEARITAKTVEIFYRGKLVAAHPRSLRPYRPTTVAEHMPSSHRRYRDWTHERIQREAAAIGEDTAALVDIILRSRPHPEQGFR